MKSTSVRLGIARNELLPKLDFVLGAYVAGLEGNRKVPEAFQNQFSEGRPGFSVGFLMEIPLGNRAARARNERRQWEVARAFREFEAAVEIGMTDVELAVRELETSYQEMLSRFQAMIAAETEANYLMERWRLLPGSDQTISFLLEDLLDAQERVADEEAAFVNAQSNYVLSIVELKRATGVLLDCESSPAAANETRRRPARPQADSPNPRTRAVPESSIPMPAGPATSRPRPVRQPWAVLSLLMMARGYSSKPLFTHWSSRPAVKQSTLQTRRAGLSCSMHRSFLRSGLTPGATRLSLLMPRTPYGVSGYTREVGGRAKNGLCESSHK